VTSTVTIPPADGSTDAWTRICSGEDVAEGGDGRRFDVLAAGRAEPAFIVRIDGVPRAYLNRCAHVPVELDWIPGRFLDETGLYVICTVHGAMYDAADGSCVAGPCQGRGLQAVACREQDGWIWVRAAVASADPHDRSKQRGRI
jgi:nitrite reductase/ring-hydroxylating ferredoxin subunit